jgi:DNA repair protein RecO (recombination protein O)
MKRESLQPAYVLHRRPYRETSFLVEIFTKEHGRVALISKGARSNGKNATQGLLQPFIPLAVSWAGKGELMALSQVEACGNIVPLRGNCLFAGFYLNELLMALLEKWDPHPRLYEYYAKSLAELQSGVLHEKTLRTFEKGLLEELGYGLLPKSDFSLHNTLVADKYYRFVPEQGLVQSELGYDAQAKLNIFSGKSLLAIAEEDWQEEETLRDAKRLSRLILMPLLGARTTHSRQLFMPLEEGVVDGK